MSSARAWITAVRHSHDRLSDLVSRHSGSGDLRAPSACSEWSVAEVLSHLGSQAQIFKLFLEAGLAGADAPGAESFQPIWDTWNAKSPEAQATDSVAANESLVSLIEGLPAADLDRFRLDMFGRRLDATGVLRMRLSEHAVHTWDVEVTFDDGAVVATEAVDLLLDGLGETAGRAGRPSPAPLDVLVATTDPQRTFRVHAGEKVSLDAAAAEDDGGPRVDLPAEAFLRLVYGRLDGSHPARGPVRTRDVDISQLSAVFEGF
ncbi:MAG TPA: maleylpyruvate isomerase family mycothiol-dependent enzyme [Acidimicrobiales bacterium]|nr:maleylpyruvate isomerase family mycothiol-dependent enzyme [Acidimicrobiales bacterium]